MKRLSPNVERILAGVCLAVGFLLMASIFAPDFTHAIGSRDPAQPPAQAPARTDQAGTPPLDPHEGLLSLGTIEDDAYAVVIVSTPDGPRYSVFARDGGDLLAALLTAEEVEDAFPALPIRSMEFESGDSLMMATPRDTTAP